MQSFQSRNRAYLPAVDHLRAFAALLVLFYHGLHVFSAQHDLGTLRPADQWIFTGNPLTAVIVEGHTGVALFMVLSGFILTHGTLGREIRYADFIRNRFLRIYPLLLVLLVFGVYAYKTQFTLAAFAQTLLFGANLPGALDLGAVSGMFWTIAVEFQFYLIFPFLLILLNKEGPKRLFLLLLAAVLIRSFALTIATSPRDLAYWTIVGRIDQFLLGMLAAWFVARHPGAARVSARLAPLAAGLVVALLFGFNQAGGWAKDAWWKLYWPTVEGLVWMVFIVCYVAAGARLPRWASAPLAGLGRLSYSMYLVHFPIMMWLAGGPFLWRPFESAFLSAFVDTWALLLPITLGVSIVTYLAIEKPFLGLRRRYATEDQPVRSRTPVSS